MRVVELEESLKGRPIDTLSKGLLDALSRIKTVISATSVLKYATGETSEYNKSIVTGKQIGRAHV